MKLRILSDLHLEFHDYNITYNSEDVLILAGDISPYPQDVMRIITNYLLQNDTVKVILVLGNHDYYYQDIEKTDKIYQSFNIDRVHILQNSCVVINGIRFCGTTLWTELSKPVVTNDFKCIKDMTLEKWNSMYSRNVEYIKSVLEQSEEPVIVVTHHLPSYKSILEKYRKYIDMSPVFASHLDELVVKCKLWIHGHTHSTIDYKIENTRVVCNPRGYHRNGSNENVDFDDNFTIIIDTN